MAELRAQRDQIDKEIEQLQLEERASVLRSVRELIAQYGLTAEQLAPSTRGVKATSAQSILKRRSPKRSKLAGVKVGPKFKHPSSGAMWSGRGSQPRWLRAALEAGQKLEDFAVKG